MTLRGIILAALAVLALAALGSCTRAGAAYETLHAAGYHDIRVGGYSMFRCGSDDSTCTKFEATGPTGVRVYGAVGCGYIGKGCTIRISGTER